MKEHKLLVASFLTILVAGVGFAVRGGLLGEWATAFGFDQTDLGKITGGGLIGFGVVILIASLFLDKFGYKPFLLLAAACFVRSSDRFYTWLITHRWFGDYIRNFRRGEFHQKVVSSNMACKYSP